jgi:hypothetical protein
MATQLDALTYTRPAPFGWRACHIFYHADQGCLLRRLVIPLVRELHASRVIDRFFFVRYALGGPHVRLRWRLVDESGENVAEAALSEQARQFFDEWPSTNSVSEELIKMRNRSLSGWDPTTRSEADRVHGDNTWEWFPVRFEVDRYGGLDCLQDTLDLFCLSSLHVLRMIAEHEDGASEWIRPAMLHFALHLACGFARGNEEEFLSVAGYGERFMGQDFAPCARRAEQVFTRRRQELMAFVSGERQKTDAYDLAAGAHRIGMRLAVLPPDIRWYAAASHVHMTANRLGVTNAEEVYLSRMLILALQALREEAPDRWSSMRRSGMDSAQPVNYRPLADAAAEAMRTLTGSAGR